VEETRRLRFTLRQNLVHTLVFHRADRLDPAGAVSRQSSTSATKVRLLARSPRKPSEFLSQFNGHPWQLTSSMFGELNGWRSPGQPSEFCLVELMGRAEEPSLWRRVNGQANHNPKRHNSVIIAEAVPTRDDPDMRASTT
jgi:hypothetical protein